MNVELIVDGEFGENGPKSGTRGEALYFRYDDEGDLMMAVLFYGYPGIHFVYPGMVECILDRPVGVNNE